MTDCRRWKGRSGRKSNLSLSAIAFLSVILIAFAIQVNVVVAQSYPSILYQFEKLKERQQLATFYSYYQLFEPLGNRSASWYSFHNETATYPYPLVTTLRNVTKYTTWIGVPSVEDIYLTSWNVYFTERCIALSFGVLVSWASMFGLWYVHTSSKRRLTCLDNGRRVIRHC